MSKTIQWLRRCALPVLLMAVTCVTASAQVAPPPPPAVPAAPATLPAPPTTMDTMPGGGTTSGSMGMTGMMDRNGTDYSLLNNPNYDYVDLKRASTLGYSDSEVASISKIARLSGRPFSFILNRVHAGRTFAWLASDYNLKLGDVLDAADEQARIARYLSLYESLDQLGTVHTSSLSTAQTISGPTLTELEATYSQLNAAFPALPSTNIETSQIGTETTTTTIVAQAPPPPPTPVQEAPPAPAPTVMPIETVVTHTYHVHRHRHHAAHRHHIHHHHHHRAIHMLRMGS